MIRIITFYRRWISPLLPPRCRFVPSCSAYAVEALEVHGTLKGGKLAVLRICRCHPFHPGGYDPVPHSVNTDTTGVGSADPVHCESARCPAHPPHSTNLNS